MSCFQNQAACTPLPDDPSLKASPDTVQTSNQSVPQYALLGFLFIFILVVFLFVFLIRTSNLCINMRRQLHGTINVRSLSVAAAPAELATVPATPAEPVLRPGQGLDPAFIQTLPMFKFKKGGIPEAAGLKGHVGDCAVCLNEYQEGENVRLLPGCKHLFHPHCVDTWLLSHTSCPICRSNVQVKKQSSLRKMLTILSGRYQLDERDGSPEGENVVMPAPEVPPPTLLPPCVPVTPDSAFARDQEVQPVAFPSSSHTGSIFQAGGGDVAVNIIPRSEVEQAMLGTNRHRRPGSEDIRWAMADLGLDTTTPRPVKRAHSLGREQVARRHWFSLYERRHSFTEMLRKSMRDPSLPRSAFRSATVSTAQPDVETGTSE